MKKLTIEMLEEFGMDGNGILKTAVTVEDFEKWSCIKLENGQENEYGQVDYKLTLIDGDFITLEVQDNVITHSYY